MAHISRNSLIAAAVGGAVVAAAVVGAVAMGSSAGAVPAAPQEQQTVVDGYRVNLSKNPNALKELGEGQDPSTLAGVERQTTAEPSRPAPSTPTH